MLQLERGILIGSWDYGLNYLAYSYHYGTIVQKNTSRAACYQQKYLDPISGSTDINACAPDEVVERIFQASYACYPDQDTSHYYGDISDCIFEKAIKNEALSLDR